jgi:prepilin-type N-terminal cleavage/methylation domain-containing protein
MRRTGKAAGFTLVELLTVVAIIGVLIGMLVPAVARARTIAKRASVMNEHHSIGIGLDMFKNEFGYYPSSLPQTAKGVNTNPQDRSSILASEVIQGSHRLAFALMGRDRQGCPMARGTNLSSPFPAGADPGPDSITGFYYTAAAGAFDGQQLDTGSWGDPTKRTSRRGPYVEISSLVALKDETNTSIPDYTWLFADTFERSKEKITAYTTRSLILYYAANERGTGIDIATTPQANQIYYYEDNQKITTNQFLDVNKDTNARDDFWNFIEDKDATIGTGATAFRRPRNPDTYLLISGGEDGLYGTDDDIINGQAAK